MKILVTYLILLISLPVISKAQHAKPEFLKEPASWEFERFALPPAFDHDFPYKGVEELRFAPGMFKKDTATYFTYAFVAELDSVTVFSQDDTRNYLLIYYKGLCRQTAKDRKLVIDTDKITVAIGKKKGLPSDPAIYYASVNMFGVFTDGAPLRLDIEVKVLINWHTQKTYLVIIASPRQRTDAIWKELYKIQNEFKLPE
jgi:hypothetical protein